MECYWFLLIPAAVPVVGSVLRFVRVRRVAAKRAGEDFDTFRAALGGGVPEDVLRATFAELRKAVPLRPDDPLDTIHDTVEELFEAAEKVVAACGRRQPAEPPDEIGPFRTVRDFVNFVVSCPPAEVR